MDAEGSQAVKLIAISVLEMARYSGYRKRDISRSCFHPAKVFQILALPCRIGVPKRRPLGVFSSLSLNCQHSQQQNSIRDSQRQKAGPNASGTCAKLPQHLIVTTKGDF